MNLTVLSAICTSQTYTSYRTDFFIEKLFQLFDLLVTAMARLATRSTISCRQARSEIFKFFIAALSEKSKNDYSVTMATGMI